MRDRQEIIGVHRVAAQVMNELARLPIVSAQPSTRTNSSSLNGSEMIVGDSIIMPRLISTVATTRSMTMKGRKMRKPIWNAVLSSLVRSEEHTSELQSLMRISYAVFCLKKKVQTHRIMNNTCLAQSQQHT